MNRVSVIVIVIILVFIEISPIATAWSNGRQGTAFANRPDNYDMGLHYGTHDWILNMAFDMLQPNEKELLMENMYLYATEIPDNRNADIPIGKYNQHHVYFHIDGSKQKDIGAINAQKYYNATLIDLVTKDYSNASRNIGIMSHFIADLSNFAHVMGENSDWGAAKNHDNIESFILTRTRLPFSSSLDNKIHDRGRNGIDAYDAAMELAKDTTFGSDSYPGNCKWMDDNYKIADQDYTNRIGESLNLAINLIADVIYNLLIESELITERSYCDKAQADALIEAIETYPWLIPILIIFNLLALIVRPPGKNNRFNIMSNKINEQNTEINNQKIKISNLEIALHNSEVRSLALSNDLTMRLGQMTNLIQENSRLTSELNAFKQSNQSNQP